MPYRTNATRCVVHLVALRGLSVTTLAQCGALRREAGRLWTDLVARHAQARTQGTWLEVGDLERATKGGQYALGSQTVQAPCQRFAANVETATQLRKEEAARGRIATQYPRHSKAYQTVIWKDQGVVWDRPEHIGLKNGAGLPYLYLPVPDRSREADIRKAELTWRAGHYELCLTIVTGTSYPPPLPEGEVAGIDLGEVHIAAIATTQRHALVLSGRLLRSFKRRRNKAHAALQERMSRCQRGSKRWRRLAQLAQRKSEASAKLYRQQREILHQAARKAVDFCRAEGVARIAVGDVRDIQTGVSLGRVVNQKIAQWPHGQFARYLREKAAHLGIAVEWVDESYSTRTCRACGRARPSSPRGRRYRCAGCGARMHRDVNGGANICSKAVYGAYGRVQADRVKYLRPIGVAPPTRA